MRRRQMNVSYFYPVILIGLVGCGGDSGGREASNSPSVSGSSEVQAEDVSISALSFSDLVVPNGYDYNPVKSQSLTVDISSVSTDRAHISVYGDFEESVEGGYKPHYQTKLISRDLEAGNTALDFSIADSQTDMLAEVWFYDDKAPIQHVFSPGKQEWIVK
jgi:hypothetical protein